MLVAECLSALVFPFRWQLTYVPILPYSQLKFIEAPVPYLMGLCYEERIPEQIFHSNICIFDIDAARLDHPEDMPAFPQQRQMAAEITQILQHFHSSQQQTMVDERYQRRDPNKSLNSRDGDAMNDEGTERRERRRRRTPRNRRSSNDHSSSPSSCATKQAINDFETSIETVGLNETAEQMKAANDSSNNYLMVRLYIDPLREAVSFHTGSQI